MPYCPQCGAEVSESDTKCPNCGALLRPPPAAGTPDTEGKAATTAGAPQPPTPAPATTPSSTTAAAPTWAIWSLILGILSFIFCPVCAPFAIWTGVVSNRQGENNGMALAGIILGIIGCISLAIAVVLGVAYLLFLFGIIGAGLASSKFDIILPFLL